MSTSAATTERGGTESARSRRVRSASIALLGLISVVVCLVLVNVLASKFSGRLDVTATGEHELAPRTRGLLESLQGAYSVALAGDLSTVDRGQLERVRDVLAQMERTSPKVAVRFLDTSSTAGQQDFQAFIADLAARDRDMLELQSRSIRAAADRGLTTAEYLETGLAPAILTIRDALPMEAGTMKLRESLEARSAACRLSAADLRVAAKAIDEPLNAKIAGSSIPQTDAAAQSIRVVLAGVGEQVSTLVKDLKSIAIATGIPAKARDAAQGLIEATEKARDAALSAAETMSRVARPDVLRVAKALGDGNACVVVGPPGTGLMAIEFGQIFPPALRGESAADAGRRAEQLVSTAIGALNTPLRPIVVLMHGELGTGLVAQKGIVSRMVERLALRGIDVAEWPVISQPQPPALATLNPDGKRPVVYATIPPDSSQAKQRPTDPAGADRAVKFGEALKLIADQGQPILLSMYPSVLPSYGDADPTTAVLGRFGLAADTARPIMRDRLTPQGRVVETEQALRVMGGEHPIQKAVRGLPTLFLWPIAIKPLAEGAAGGTAGAPAGAGAGAELTPLFEVLAETESWSESQWLNFWRLPRSERAVVPNAPTFDQGRDIRDVPTRVAWAAQIPPAAGRGRQRLIAIGTNRWFMDPVTTPMISVDGRTLAANPGNIELFEASVYWLAGQDELIAQSPEARAAAMIQAVSPGTLRGIRLGMAAVLPLLVLAAGALFRLLRG